MREEAEGAGDTPEAAVLLAVRFSNLPLSLALRSLS